MATSTNSNVYLDILDRFQTYTKKPENYLGIQNDLTTDIKCLIKRLYDFTKSVEDSPSNTDALPELIIKDFDDEQIWQELELQNSGKCNSFISDIAHLVARKDKLQFAERFEGERNTDEPETLINTFSRKSKNEDVEMDKTDNETNSNSGESEKEESQKSRQKPKKKRKGKQSVVDDQFFKLKDFEELDKLDLQQSKRKNDQADGSSSDEDSIDWFGEDGNLSNEEKEGELYSSFFDSPDITDNEVGNKEDQQSSGSNNEFSDFEEQNFDSSKKVTFNFQDNAHADLEVNDMESDDEVEDEKEEGKSKEHKTSFETRQERLKSRISELETEALAEKPWQLKGEVSATSRPQNSMLEEVVEFDMTTRPAPVITEQTTLKLEDLIIQRIKDKAWDDVERKVKPVDNPQEFKKKLVLNQEKSKLSLAQIYEEEYLKQKSALEPDHDDKEEEPEAHRVIRAMMSSLFAKLDALSNFHYTPKPILPEIKVISNVPAINMEEVAPVGTTTAMLLAPEEVKEKRKGEVMGKKERTATDRKRERRHKKMMQRDRRKEKETREKEVEKIRPGLGNKYSKEKAIKILEKVSKDKNVMHMKETSSSKSIRSSTAFFNQLHDEVTSHIKAKIQGNKKRKVESSAKKLKL